MEPGKYPIFNVTNAYFTIPQENNGNDEEPDPLDPSEMPQFEFSSASLAESTGGSMVDLGLLFLLNIIFFGTAFSAFLRYDLR